MSHLKKASSGHLLKSGGGHLVKGCPSGCSCVGGTVTFSQCVNRAMKIEINCNLFRYTGWGSGAGGRYNNCDGFDEGLDFFVNGDVLLDGDSLSVGARYEQDVFGPSEWFTLPSGLSYGSPGELTASCLAGREGITTTIVSDHEATITMNDIPPTAADIYTVEVTIDCNPLP